MQMKVKVIFVRAVVFEPAAPLHLNPKVFVLIREVAQLVDFFDKPTKIFSTTF